MRTINSPPAGFITRSRAGPRGLFVAARRGGSTILLQLYMCLCAVIVWKAGLGDEVLGLFEELQRELTRISAM